MSPDAPSSVPSTRTAHDDPPPTAGGAAGSPTADVLVVGGGAAGLAAATALARFRYGVVVVDAGEPRNAPAHGVHNHLSRDGVPPAELLAAGRRDLAAYGVDVVAGAVVSVRHAAPSGEAGADGTSGPEFSALLADGSEVRSRRVLVASGAVDDLPPVPGLAQRWGRDVLHCPFCHGWEVRDQRIAVLATEARSLHSALLWRRITEHLTVVLAPGVEPDEQQWQQLAALGIAVVEDGPVVELLTAEDRVVGVRLAGGHVVDCDAVAVTTAVRARVEFLEPLGLVPGELLMGGMRLGTRLEAGEAGATAVPGVFVAGNAKDPSAQLAASAAAGTTAAAAVIASLVQEDTAAAVRAREGRPVTTAPPTTAPPTTAPPATGPVAPIGGRGEPFSAAAEREVCERVLGDRRHGL